MFKNTTSPIAMIAATTLLPASIAAADPWSGVSFSVGGGYGMANHEFDFGPGPFLPPDSFSAEIDGLGGRGGFFSLGAGYDRKISDTIVVGAFIDYDFADIETDLGISIPPFGDLNANANIAVENQLAIGARLGFLASPDTLFFATFGYARADVSDLTASFAFGGPPTSVELASVGSLNGVFIGGGIETLLSNGFSVKAEYRYTDLDGERISILPGSGIDDFVSVSLAPSIQTGRIALAYRYDASPQTADSTVAPETPIGGSWTGGYIGVGGGYGAAVNELSLQDRSPVPGSVFSASLDGFGHEGGIIALSAGYDVQTHARAVIGGFIDYDFMNLDHEDSLDIDGFVSGGLDGEIKDILMIGGRVGYLTSSDTLVFASFGYATSELSPVTVSGSIFGGPPASLTLIDGERLSGFFLGAGMETRLTADLSLKAEYRYVDLGSEEVTLFPGTGGFGDFVNSIVSTEYDPVIQTGRLTLNYRFGGPRDAIEPVK